MEDPRILAPIPTPPAQRWREVRLLYLPRTVFVVGVLVAAWLWSHSVAPATLVAEADIEQANLRSTHAGVITSLTVGLSEPVTPPGSKAPEAPPKPAEPLPAAAPVPLIAPIDGVVTRVMQRQGDEVDADDSVLRIVSRRVNRLTGYLRQPLAFDPEPGMKVQIRTRGTSHMTATSTITGVGAAMESIPSNLLAAMRVPANAAQEHGLRVNFAMPKELTLRPGEHVDVIIIH
jgi:multidrug resistance efflux pump